jgi:hypothetical protein
MNVNTRDCGEVGSIKLSSDEYPSSRIHVRISSARAVIAALGAKVVTELLFDGLSVAEEGCTDGRVDGTLDGIEEGKRVGC